MKFIIGFVFILISVSSSFSLRELDFMKSLYPGQILPKPIFTAIVNRRISQVTSLHANPSLTNDAKTFYKATNQSLLLVLDLLNSDQYHDNDTVIFYKETVDLIDVVKKYLASVSQFQKSDNIDAHSVNSADRASYSHDQLQELVDAYIDDIKLVTDYEKSAVDSKRVDMKIVNHLNELSNQVKANIIYSDFTGSTDLMTYPQAIARKAMDQCLRRLDFLLDKFIANFVHE